MLNATLRVHSCYKCFTLQANYQCSHYKGITKKSTQFTCINTRMKETFEKYCCCIEPGTSTSNEAEWSCDEYCGYSASGLFLVFGPALLCFALDIGFAFCTGYFIYEYYTDTQIRAQSTAITLAVVFGISFLIFGVILLAYLCYVFSDLCSLSRRRRYTSMA
jgi:hypothetical protein